MDDAMDCPRCDSTMVERPLGSTTIHQCPQGHGIYLDRRDLADLIDAENDFHRDGDGFHTQPLPRITANMTSPPPASPKAPAWVASLFA